MPRTIGRPRQVVYGIVLVLTGVGCTARSAGQPELAPVSGRVTLDGQPLRGVSVVFESAGGVLSFGNTDADGRYTVAYIRSARGAGLGNNVVRISEPALGPSSPLRKSRIPSIYNTASTLTAHVAKGSNVFDFALESTSGSK